VGGSHARNIVLSKMCPAPRNTTGKWGKFLSPFRPLTVQYFLMYYKVKLKLKVKVKVKLSL
jgi:hypothetical protein